MAVQNLRIGLAIGIACFLVELFFSGSMVLSDEEGSVDAEVEVLPGGNASYGASVSEDLRTLLAHRALGAPDQKGAFIMRRGWVSLELEGVVKGCDTISIWSARRGWGRSDFNIYASTDGSSWVYIGSGACESRKYTRYDFNGVFGDVRYIKVEHSSPRPWSFITLDAVWAKGGGA